MGIKDCINPVVILPVPYRISKIQTGIDFRTKEFFLIIHIAILYARRDIPVPAPSLIGNRGIRFTAIGIIDVLSRDHVGTADTQDYTAIPAFKGTAVTIGRKISLFHKIRHPGMNMKPAVTDL